MTTIHSSLSLLLVLVTLSTTLQVVLAAPPIVSRFVHISDFHTDPLYNPRGNRTVNYCRTAVEPPIVNGTKLPERIIPNGQYGCDAPPLLTKSSYVHERCAGIVRSEVLAHSCVLVSRSLKRLIQSPTSCSCT